MTYDIAVSIVAFNNSSQMLAKAIESASRTGLKTYTYLVDNSPIDKLRNICSSRNQEYIFNNKNVGFGAGHNIAIRRAIGKTKYFLALNPDVYFDQGILEKLFNFMEENEKVGLVMPRVTYPDGTPQCLCRLLPSPVDILLRKVNMGIFNPLFERQKVKFELKSADYTRIMDVPYLSGCFMFIRTKAFEQVGMFDERYFMHFEDVDLTRRIHKLYRTVYYPDAAIYHAYERSSNKDVKVFKHLVSSGIKYFNKWGWFLDRERRSINKKTLDGILITR